MRRYGNIDLKRSMYEGVFAHMFATLTGGVFLTGFAIHLGMDEFTIGLLASLPFLVTVFQIPASHIMGKNGRRKKYWFWGSAIARITWIPILIVALLPGASYSIKISIILILVFFSYSCNSVSSISWLSLMSDLVPDGIRGHFFGTRNMLCGAAGLVAMLFFGNFLDYMKNHSNGMLPLGFSITFISAVSFGVLGLYFVKRISDPQVERCGDRHSFRENLTIPFRETNFRNFLIYGFCWSFSVHFAAPFFTLYFLRDLKFSYGFVAALGIMSALADMAGMRLWGKISDKVKNRPIIQLGSWIAAFIPIVWIIVKPGSVIIPILINTISGGFWAGINLCTSNLLLRISPQENKAPFLSLYNTAGGLGAAAAPILSGFALMIIAGKDLTFLPGEMLPMHVIFVVSTALRLLSLQFFKRVHEPEEADVGQLVRVLRNIRGLNVAAGFNYLLHPFIEFARNGMRNGSDKNAGKRETTVEHDGFVRLKVAERECKAS